MRHGDTVPASGVPLGMEQPPAVTRTAPIATVVPTLTCSLHRGHKAQHHTPAW